MYLYQRIRDLREDSDKSQAQIAEYLGMKQQQYARYEAGIQEIPLRLGIRPLVVLSQLR